MASSCSSGSKVTLKLLIDTVNEKVLFAEAGKEFVDLPVGTVVRLLKKTGMVGCIGTLYNSIENLNDSYMLSSSNKNMILKPKSPYPCSVSPLLLLNDSVYSAPKTYYRCGSINNRVTHRRCHGCGYNNHYSGEIHCLHYVSNHSNAVCPACESAMTSKATWVEPPNSSTNDGQMTTDEGGYVKGVVTYMVMDDLVVRPMSTISCITLLNSFNVKDVGVLEEKVVELSMDEAIKLLKASFQSKTVLTDVFLQKKGTMRRT